MEFDTVVRMLLTIFLISYQIFLSEEAESDTLPKVGDEAQAADPKPNISQNTTQSPTSIWQAVTSNARYYGTQVWNIVCSISKRCRESVTSVADAAKLIINRALQGFATVSHSVAGFIDRLRDPASLSNPDTVRVENAVDDSTNQANTPH